jgi:tetratricopeptide (TPR) repeat protein
MATRPKKKRAAKAKTRPRKSVAAAKPKKGRLAKAATKRPTSKKKRKPARKASRPATSLARLDLVISAHPGLVLVADDRAVFARECPDLDAVMKAHARDATVLFKCAWAYRKLGRFDDAHRAADRALAVERTFETLTAKATVYRAGGDVDGATALFDEAARLDPDDTSASMEAGRTFGEAGRFAEAAAAYDRVLERDPERVDARIWMTYASFMAMKTHEHITTMQELAKTDALAEELLADMLSR